MFEDFTFCLSCEHYDNIDRLCKLFKCVKVCGCQSGEERKPRNRYEMLKAMSMEEMAVWLDDVSKSWYDEGYTKESDEPAMSSYPATASEWIKWLKEEI